MMITSGRNNSFTTFAVSYSRGRGPKDDRYWRRKCMKSVVLKISDTEEFDEVIGIFKK